MIPQNLTIHIIIVVFTDLHNAYSRLNLLFTQLGMSFTRLIIVTFLLFLIRYHLRHRREINFFLSAREINYCWISFIY